MLPKYRNLAYSRQTAQPLLTRCVPPRQPAGCSAGGSGGRIRRDRHRASRWPKLAGHARWHGRGHRHCSIGGSLRDAREPRLDRRVGRVRGALLPRSDLRRVNQCVARYLELTQYERSPFQRRQVTVSCKVCLRAVWWRAVSPDRKSRKRPTNPGRSQRVVRTRPSSDDAHDVVYFKRHHADDSSEAVPGQEFLAGCPTKVRATMRAVLVTRSPLRRRSDTPAAAMGGDEGRHDRVVRGACRWAETPPLPPLLPLGL